MTRTLYHWIFKIILLTFCLLQQTLFADPASLTEKQKAYLASVKTIRLCVGPDTMPLDDIVDGEHTGINSEYMKIFQAALNTPIRLIETEDWNQSIEFIKQAKCDVISLATKTPQREDFMAFTDNYVEIPFVVVTTQEKFFVSKLADLIDRRLGVRKGYAYVDLLKNRFPGIELIEFEELAAGLRAVDRNEIFGYLTGLHIAGYAIQNSGNTNLKINGQFDELAMISLGIGVRKEMLPLVSIFNEAIATVDSETKKRIDNSWLTVRYEIVEDYKRFVQLLIITCVFLLFLAYRQFHLRRHNIQLAEREKEIWNQANFDFLTGLPNRRLFQDRLAQKLNRIHRKGEPFALLLVDLDAFKEINDTLGHDQGDKLLKEAAERLEDCLRKSDTLARLGGDEFVIILNDISNESDIEVVTQKILTQLKRPFQLKENAFISASIGITLCPKDSTDMVELLKNADQAMYAAKASGRNAFNYFTPDMQQQAMLRMLLVKELRQAIDHEQFELFYQPIVNLKTGRIEKAEALIRWQHPERGYVSPFEFIPVLEETRMIIQVGNWVFKQAASQIKIWREKYDSNLQVSVNSSPLQFEGESTHHWNENINKLGASSEAVAIEITESLLMEKESNLTEHLRELRSQGFELSLDDFGTGYSSLSYLRKFDIDYLKIDKSFVQNLTMGSDDIVLCEAIIVMAHKLGLRVIAEGVETREQRDLLANIDCDYGQGYYFAKPAPSVEFEKILKQQLKCA